MDLVAACEPTWLVTGCSSGGDARSWDRRAWHAHGGEDLLAEPAAWECVLDVWDVGDEIEVVTQVVSSAGPEDGAGASPGRRLTRTYRTKRDLAICLLGEARSDFGRIDAMPRSACLIHIAQAVGLRPTFPVRGADLAVRPLPDLNFFTAQVVEDGMPVGHLKHALRHLGQDHWLMLIDVPSSDRFLASAGSLSGDPVFFPATSSAVWMQLVTFLQGARTLLVWGDDDMSPR
jgi:hypothetical protein